MNTTKNDDDLELFQNLWFPVIAKSLTALTQNLNEMHDVKELRLNDEHKNEFKKHWEIKTKWRISLNWTELTWPALLAASTAVAKNSASESINQKNLQNQAHLDQKIEN